MSRARRTFPVTYALPRDGCTLRVTVENEDNLRLVRTELELLRRVRRQVRQLVRRRGTRASRRMTPDQRRELMRILADAEDPAVDRAVRRIDWDFPAVRHTIVMSVVDDEAARIAQDAVSMEPTAHIDHSYQSSDDDSTLESALAQAEAQLDALNRLVTHEAEPAAAATVGGLASGAGGRADEVQSDGAHAANGLRADDDDGPDAPIEESSGLPMDPDFEADHSDAARLTAATPADGAPPADAYLQAGGAAAAGDQTAVLNANREAAGLDSFPTGRRDRCSGAADDAVALIESGLRRLGDVLAGEVHAKWRTAQASLDEIATLRLQMQQTLEASRQITAQLSRIRDELEINRDQTDVYRREAALFRDDTLKAKQVAERHAGGNAAADRNS